VSGDLTNTALWQNADVYIGPSGTPGPTDVSTAWASGWDAVGLLDGDKGFTESRADTSNDYYAWGGILVRTTKSKQKRSIKFVALEDNATVFALINPGSTRTTAAGLTTSTVTVPVGAEFAIGFEVRDGDKIRRRSALRATVDAVGDVVDSEGALVAYEVTVIIYPDADGTLYTDIAGTLSAS
jgi:hypothetical protein